MADHQPIFYARFWSKVEVSEASACWLWRAARSEKGYGRFGDQKAHRVAYELFHGPLDHEAVVMHKCDNPPCCNPAHLRAASTSENVADKMAKGRHISPSGMAHPRAKLTEEQVDIIRRSSASGADLARALGVSQSTISYVRSYKRRADG